MQFLKKVLYAIRWVYVLPIRFYQKFISPLLPPSCLYEPSCSEYTRQAIMKFGIFPGTFMGMARILRCNSAFFTGGDDPVPEKLTFKAISGPWGKFKRFGKKKKKDEDKGHF